MFNTYSLSDSGFASSLQICTTTPYSIARVRFKLELYCVSSEHLVLPVSNGEVTSAMWKQCVEEASPL